jgi:hypothetical protein
MKKLLSVLFGSMLMFALTMPAVASDTATTSPTKTTKTHKVKGTKVHKTHKTSNKVPAKTN